MTFKRISVLGLPLDVDGDVDAICVLLRKQKTPRLITFVGPGAWTLARKDPLYAAALGNMSLVLPDGPGIAFLCRLLTGEDFLPYGFDMQPFTKAFFDTVMTGKLSLALAGGGPGNDEDVHAKLELRYPGLNFAQTMHGYGDFAPKTAALMSKPPDVVAVGMGAPRQETFMMALRDAGFKGAAVACGDFFDDFDHFPAVVQNDPCPAWVDRHHLRHLYRLYHKPQKLWRRYVVDYPLFLMLVIRTIVGGMVEKGRALRQKI